MRSRGNSSEGHKDIRKKRRRTKGGRKATEEKKERTKTRRTEEMEGKTTEDKYKGGIE